MTELANAHGVKLAHSQFDAEVFDCWRQQLRTDRGGQSLTASGSAAASRVGAAGQLAQPE